VDERFHYPPELFNLLIEAIPDLVKSKKDVLIFFRGAGVKGQYLEDLEEQVATARDSIAKTEIARTVLSRVNEAGDSALAARREIVKRVAEFDDFSTTWPDQRDRAENLVGRVRAVVGKKDAFTRMQLERDAEAQKGREVREAAAARLRQRAAAIESLRVDLGKLFGMSDPWRRGKALEPLLTRFFSLAGCRVVDSFELRNDQGGAVEQIDGAIEFDGHVYLVEAKWRADPIGPDQTSQALVRIHGRAEARGLIVSATPFTPASIEQVRGALATSVVVLAELAEVVALLEAGSDPKEWLALKVRAAILDRKPLHRVAP
jgi:hypothetical protein